MSGLHGVEKTLLPETRSLTIPDAAKEDPDQCLTLRGESEAAPAMAETSEASVETVARPSPQLSEDGGVPWDPADGAPAPQIRVDGCRGHLATRAQQEEALPLTEGLEAASELVATVSRPKSDFQGEEKALETCGAKRSGSEVMVEAKVLEAKAEKGSMPSVAVGAEERAEVKEGVVEEAMEVEQPAGGEVEAVEDRRVVEEAEEARPWHMDLRMNPLEAIQMELDTVNAQADRAFQQLEQKFGRMRRHYLERRNYIIQNIPGFWMTAFRNHPQLSAMIRGQDAEMLRYVTNLEVKELRHPKTGCKFKFFFRRNPYFRNKLIVKEYEVRSSGRVVSLSTPIMWRRGREPQSFIRRNQDLICSFFTWFSDHSLPESDRIAEIIKEELWPNPLQYYLLREGVCRARRRPIREPVEIPRPFGFQSG
ncbi:testis-specific Y-encoded-like protein 1 [Marmota marmota marmota]|uniref:testis-specific Y-encoded-like protein 1 n=1 Tax=Marmota marmota marmota TaxID=9994 RepID=UPI00076295AF|nr:testis-specific Y-encoded-like protein 1 [Marmota marmota marmota]